MSAQFHINDYLYSVYFYQYYLVEYEYTIRPK